MNCKCGHPRCLHDYYDGCTAFKCCTRTRNLTPGRRHTEHDFANHQAQPCLCNTYQQGDK